MEENKHEFDDWINFWEPKLSEVYAWAPHNYVDGRNYRDISGQEQKTCGRPLQGPLNIAVNGEAHVCCFDYNKLLRQCIDPKGRPTHQRFIRSKVSNLDARTTFSPDPIQGTSVALSPPH